MFAAPFFQNFFMIAAPLQCTLVVWYSVCTTMTNGGTGTVPPLVMEMQTGSTNDRILKILLVFFHCIIMHETGYYLLFRIKTR
jgi:hypothetical protein